MYVNLLRERPSQSIPSPEQVHGSNWQAHAQIVARKENTRIIRDDLSLRDIVSESLFEGLKEISDAQSLITAYASLRANLRFRIVSLHATTPQEHVEIAV